MRSPAESMDLILQAGWPLGYRFCVVLAMAGASWLMARDARSWPLGRRDRWIVILSSAYGSLLGCMIPTLFARGEIAASVGELRTQNPAWFSHALLGPKTILGGLLFGFLVCALFKKLFDVRYDTSDSFARSTAWMLFVGRIGCVLQHCCYGRTSQFLGVDLGDGVLRFPVQVLEAALNGLMLLWVFDAHAKNLWAGRRFFIVLFLYGASRAFTELLREPVGGQIQFFGYYQLWALALVITAGYQLFRRSMIDMNSSSSSG